MVDAGPEATYEEKNESTRPLPGYLIVSIPSLLCA